MDLIISTVCSEGQRNYYLLITKSTNTWYANSFNIVFYILHLQYVRLLNDFHNCIIISSRVDYEQMTSCQLTRQLNWLVRLTGITRSAQDFEKP